MRIAIFTNNYLPNPYGVSTSIETFRQEFEKLGPASPAGGHQVFIFAPKWKGYVDKNPHVFRYPSIDINIKFRFPLPIPYSWKMRRILKTLDLDIIHAQHPNLLGTAAKKWARRKKIPLVFTWHTLYDQYTNFVPFIPPKMSAGYMIRKAVKFANAADAVIVPTNSIRPMIRKWGVKNDIVPIMTGIVEKEFEGAKGDLVRKKYNIQEDETLLLVVTRLTAEKNVDFLFRSIIPVLEKNKKAKFLVVADGYLMDKLRKYVSDKNISAQIIFAGFVPNDEKKNYYAASDIFVFASKSETQGMVISEAMYSGLPVVAVNATGSASLVLNNANGFLVKENEEEFGRAVEKLIDDKNLRHKFGAASKKIAWENFTSDISARRMLEVYENAIKNYSK